MRFYIFFIFLIPISSFSQNLNYDDLKTILSKSLVESNEYIESKGYRIFTTNMNQGDNQISYIWDKIGNTDLKVAYLLITWDKSKGYKMVWYQFHSSSYFEQLKKNIEQKGFKLTGSYVKFESLYYQYTNDIYSITMSKGEKNYTFSITYSYDKVIKGEIIPRY